MPPIEKKTSRGNISDQVEFDELQKSIENISTAMTGLKTAIGDLTKSQAPFKEAAKSLAEFKKGVSINKDQLTKFTKTIVDSIEKNLKANNKIESQFFEKQLYYNKKLYNDVHEIRLFLEKTFKNFTGTAIDPKSFTTAFTKALANVKMDLSVKLDASDFKTAVTTFKSAVEALSKTGAGEVDIDPIMQHISERSDVLLRAVSGGTSGTIDVKDLTNSINETKEAIVNAISNLGGIKDSGMIGEKISDIKSAVVSIEKILKTKDTTAGTTGAFGFDGKSIIDAIKRSLQENISKDKTMLRGISEAKQKILNKVVDNSSIEKTTFSINLSDIFTKISESAGDDLSSKEMEDFSRVRSQLLENIAKSTTDLKIKVKSGYHEDKEGELSIDVSDLLPRKMSVPSKELATLQRGIIAKVQKDLSKTDIKIKSGEISLAEFIGTETKGASISSEARKAVNELRMDIIERLRTNLLSASEDSLKRIKAGFKEINVSSFIPRDVAVSQKVSKEFSLTQLEVMTKLKKAAATTDFKFARSTSVSDFLVGDAAPKSILDAISVVVPLSYGHLQYKLLGKLKSAADNFDPTFGDEPMSASEFLTGITPDFFNFNSIRYATLQKNLLNKANEAVKDADFSFGEELSLSQFFGEDTGPGTLSKLIFAYDFFKVRNSLLSKARKAANDTEFSFDKQLSLSDFLGIPSEADALNSFLTQRSLYKARKSVIDAASKAAKKFISEGGIKFDAEGMKNALVPKPGKSAADITAEEQEARAEALAKKEEEFRKDLLQRFDSTILLLGGESKKKTGKDEDAGGLNLKSIKDFFTKGSLASLLKGGKGAASLLGRGLGMAGTALAPMALPAAAIAATAAGGAALGYGIYKSGALSKIGLGEYSEKQWAEIGKKEGEKSKQQAAVTKKQLMDIRAKGGGAVEGKKLLERKKLIMKLGVTGEEAAALEALPEAEFVKTVEETYGSRWFGKGTEAKDALAVYQKQTAGMEAQTASVQTQAEVVAETSTSPLPLTNKESIGPTIVSSTKPDESVSILRDIANANKDSNEKLNNIAKSVKNPAPIKYYMGRNLRAPLTQRL